MTTHPITPPPELVQQWDEEGTNMLRPAYQTHLCTRAARWGADQELEACCEWLVLNYNYPEAGNPLRVARRPKPPSLKEKALEALKVIECEYVIGWSTETIRRALETLPNG